MKYEINKPDTELTEGYFTLFLKYFTLFILGWFAGWLFLLFYEPSKVPSLVRTDFTNFLLDNPGIVSLVVGIAVVCFFARRAYNKYKLGLITNIEFDDVSSILTLGLLNTINGAFREKIIGYGNIKTTLELKEDKLFGKQRVFEIFENNVLVNRINIELTAWCRHPDIDAIVDRLNTFASNSFPKSIRE
jgi:hypothetical protein